MTSRTRLWVTVIAIWLAFPGLLPGQLGMGNGRIMGVIQDEAGNRLAGAQIKVVHLEYKNELAGASDAKGRWQISGIAGGRYGITVSLRGYQNAQVEITVSLATKLTHTLDITMKKGEADAITVEPKAESVALAKLLQEGNQLYNEQRYAEARAKFEAFLAENPEAYQVQINLGNCYLQERSYDQAIAAYTAYLDGAKAENASLKGNETAAKVMASIGRAYLEQGRIDPAVEIFKQAIDAYPGDATLAYNVGEVLFNKGRAEEAVPYLEMATRLDKSWPLPFLKLGYAYLNQARYVPARESFQAFLALAPEDPQADTVRAVLKSLDDLTKKSIHENAACGCEHFGNDRLGRMTHELRRFAQGLKKERHFHLEWQVDRPHLLRSRGSTYYKVRLHPCGLASGAARLVNRYR